MNRKLYEAKQDLLEAKGEYRRAYRKYRKLLEYEEATEYRGVDEPDDALSLARKFPAPPSPRGYELIYLGSNDAEDYYLGVPTYESLRGKLTDIRATASSKNGSDFKLMYVDGRFGNSLRNIEYLLWGKSGTANRIFNAAMRSTRVPEDDKRTLRDAYTQRYHAAERINNAGRGRGIDAESDLWDFRHRR